MFVLPFIYNKHGFRPEWIIPQGSILPGLRQYIIAC